MHTGEHVRRQQLSVAAARQAGEPSQLCVEAAGPSRSSPNPVRCKIHPGALGVRVFTFPSYSPDLPPHPSLLACRLFHPCCLQALGLSVPADCLAQPGAAPQGTRPEGCLVMPT